MGRRLYRSLRAEQLESRRPLAADLAALDINDDLSVTALDALLIINTINQRAANANAVVTAESEADLNCDTNSDGVVTPIDVLNVVNQINSGIIAVPTDDPTDTTDPNGTDETDSQDSTDDNPVTDTDPGDDVTTSPNDDSATDDTDSSDDSDPVDETDETDTDDDVVSDPSDDSTDDSNDDSNDDDSSDETTDDDDDTSTDHPECDHERPVREIMSGLLSGRGHRGRGDLFAALDDNGDGALSNDEVPEALWNVLVEADTDSSDSVTKAELTAYKEAQRRAAVEAFFEELDADGSGAITSADVSRLAWRFLSRADANNDGSITVEELLAVPLPGRLGS